MVVLDPYSKVKSYFHWATLTPGAAMKRSKHCLDVVNDSARHSWACFADKENRITLQFDELERFIGYVDDGFEKLGDDRLRVLELNVLQKLGVAADVGQKKDACALPVAHWCQRRLKHARSGFRQRSTTVASRPW